MFSSRRGWTRRRNTLCSVCRWKPLSGWRFARILECSCVRTLVLQQAFIRNKSQRPWTFLQFYFSCMGLRIKPRTSCTPSKYIVSPRSPCVKNLLTTVDEKNTQYKNNSWIWEALGAAEIPLATHCLAVSHTSVKTFLGLESSGWTWWHPSIILALRRLRQEDHKLKNIRKPP